MEPSSLPYQASPVGHHEELAYLNGLSKLERRAHFQREVVLDEEGYLGTLIASCKIDDDNIKFYASKARGYIAEGKYDLAEAFAAVAQGYKDHRATVADIRKQREKVQWEKTKLREIQQQMSEELKPYLEP